MATSTVPTLKANLVAQLQARPGLSGVQISYGAPIPNPQREFIWIGDVSGDQTPATFAAPNQREEEYDVDVLFRVLKEGENAQAADERCFVLLGELETQLRSDPKVNSAVALAQIGSFRLAEYVGDGTNRSAEMTIQVHCQAWI